MIGLPLQPIAAEPTAAPLPPPSTWSLSVALVTRNRPDSLERTLASLRAQEAQPLEVLVSDDSDEVHRAATKQVALAHGCKYLQGPGRGLYANRNRAALACQGTHVRTMDDDHEFPDGHLEACLAGVAHDPEAVWIIGEHYPGKEPWSVPPPCPGQLHPRGFSAPPPNPQRCWAIADGASIYPRELFERGVRYCEAYRFGAAYLELGSRLFWMGRRIRHLEETFVIHHYDPAARSVMDFEADLSSRLFAMLCHSGVFQPSWRNRGVCAVEVARLLAAHPASGRRALARAVRAFRRHRKELLSSTSSLVSCAP